MITGYAVNWRRREETNVLTITKSNVGTQVATDAERSQRNKGSWRRNCDGLEGEGSGGKVAMTVVGI